MDGSWRRFVRVKYRSTSDPTLAFSWLVPRTCTPVAHEADHALASSFVPLLHYEGGAGIAHRICGVWIALAGSNLRLADLAPRDARRRGHTVLRTRPDHADRDVELLARFTLDGRTWLRASRFVRDGPHLFRVEAGAVEPADADDLCRLLLEMTQITQSFARPATPQKVKDE